MNGAHFHLILNHVPVLGTAFGALVLAFALLRKDDSIKKLALGVFGLVALGAVATFLTGEPAEDVVKGVAGVSLAAIEPHEELAGVALWGSIIVGVVAVAGLFWFRGGKPVASWAGPLVLAAALVVGGLMSWTAFLGGKIRHTEVHVTAMQPSEEKQ